MATLISTFNRSLYREHAEEASFLYDQRQAAPHNPDLNWPDVRDWEERFEAHIDGLAIGGMPAAGVCREQAASGDAGTVHTALVVLCRQGRKADVFEMLRALDLTDETLAMAIRRALCVAVPTSWRDDLTRQLERTHAELASVLIHVIGYRRFASEETLHRKIADLPPEKRVDVAWALGRIGTTASVPVLLPLLKTGDGHTRQTVAIALMRLGNKQGLESAMEEAATQTWARRVLAIGGDTRAVMVLNDIVRDGTANADAVIALGLLGHLSAVAPLLDLLENDELSRAAAIALNVITGAGLYSRVFVPDVIDPDELQHDQRAAYDKDGTVPTRLGEPYGTWERAPLADKVAWRAWLDANKYRFSRDRRWRFGVEYGIRPLVECLRAETTPYVVRAATYEELVVRYGLDIPFEVDLAVLQQQRILSRMTGWAENRLGDYLPGAWYFARSLQE